MSAAPDKRHPPLVCLAVIGTCSIGLWAAIIAAVAAVLP